jgi:carboxypeptidase family protein/immune inhibitor InhA-like protein/flagellar hook capping protein FlgD
MKKTLLVLFTLILLAGMLLAENKVRVERPVSDRDQNAGNFGNIMPPTDDLFDLQFDYPVGVGGGEAGFETDGNYMYTTAWNGVVFYKYAMDGTYIEEFAVDGCPGGIRDLAYDGQYFYGAAATTTVYEMDFDAMTTISTITAPVAVRGIAYDEVSDGFWANNWSDEITLFDRSGATLNSFPCGTWISYYGFAWENVSDGGPYLWGFSQGGNLNQLVQIEIATGLETGVNFDLTTIMTLGTGSAGGLCISDAFVPGMWTIAGTSQNVNIWGLELGIAADPAAPGAPTELVVTPDAGGALEALISWTCPTLQVDNEPLTDLDEMRIYRDGVLIYTDPAPVIGGPGTYPDFPTESGQYGYSVVGYNDLGEGIPVAMSTWVGEDVPNGVTDLMLEDLSTDTDLIAYVSWVNPTDGLHGGPFNEPILGYHVVRSDMVEFELTGVLTEMTDETLTVIDYYSYSITPYNSVGDGATIVSNTNLITTANIMFADDFSGGLANWTVVNNGGTADWIISNDPDRYDMPATSLPPVCTADSDLAGIGSTMDTEIVLVTPLDCSEMIDVILEFDSDFNMIGDADYGYVDISVNGGVDWTNVFTYNGADVPAAHEMLNISPVVAGFTEVLIRFHSVQPGWNYWWTIDNVMVSGTEGELGAIVGTVTDAVSTDPIEGAIVTFSGTTQTTDAVGYYEFATAFPGTYTLTCTADGYYDGEEESIVLSGETTTTDFAMDPFEFATLAGTVTDDDSGEPIEGAEISMVSELGYAYDAITIADGTYSIADIVADTYDITCTASMYIPQTIMAITCDPGAAITQDFALGLSISYFSDFEDNDGYLLSSDPNCWQWGAPTFGPGAAYSGDNAWATALGAEYPNGSNATLDTTIPVGIVSSAYILEFWHWYDIETSWDGGNVKISADNGATWEILTPSVPYPGIGNASNPLTTEPIYTGLSAGWEIAQFDLAAYVGENVLIRWHFGSDGSVPYPGWYIDDVAIYEQEYGSIEGTVTEFGTGALIENAEITAGPYSAVSGADGSYVIDGVVTGTYTVECDHALYLPIIVGDFDVEAGAATIADIGMLWSEIAVDPTALNSVLAEDATETQTFVITNDGPGDLEYSIGYDFPVTVTISENPGKEVANNQRSANIAAKNARSNSSDNDLAPHAFSNIVGTPPTDEIYDLQFEYPCAVATGEAGVETDGNYIYTTEWNGAAGFFRYELDGTYVGTFNVAGAGNVRDLAYDGQYFYGAAANTSLFEMDFTPGAETLISTITAPVACRAIAYDPVNDGFWANNWSDQITLFDRSGTTLDSFAPGAMISFYGFAWEDVLPGGPYLWGASQSGTGNELVKMDIANGGAQLEVYDIANSGITYVAGTDICGGLYITDQIVPGKWTIGGIIQNLTIWGLELADAVSWVMVTENASGTVAGNGGSVTVTVTFDATDLVEGDVLVADLVIGNNAGDDVIIPVTLTVTGSIAGETLPVLHTILNNNYPNPFNPNTNIAYSIKDAAKVTLEVYNVKGQLVKTLVNDHRETGHYNANWNGKDNSSKTVASGVYFYKMKAGNYVSTKKMILMK